MPPNQIKLEDFIGTKVSIFIGDGDPFVGTVTGIKDVEGEGRWLDLDNGKAAVRASAILAYSHVPQ